MNDNLVTVCIPVYNHDKYVAETIKSIINQTYQNIELYIVNDGSSDNSHKEVSKLYEECKKRFVFFEYINRENKGLIPTLNEVLVKCSGKYFMAIASDDIAINDRVEKQVNCLEEDTECSLCFGRAIGIDENSQITDKYKNKFKNYKSLYTFEDLIMSNVIMATTVMLRTSTLKEVGGYDERFKIEDWPLWLKMSKKSPVKYIDEDLVYYRDHATNTNKNSILMLKEQEYVLMDWKGDPVFKKAMSKYNLYTFSTLVKLKQKELAKEYLLFASKSSWYKPKFLKALTRYFFI